ncbi:hypothetical protein POJ06DRAFT_250402 [Lipomyces tetrasporus]|uniref:Uncharacterized protein n=1 Tax=Lipomyces tetrasporus TaxID=54092 RepID=A0AAD7VTK9_9ASCO|nr:uncharacterized protein POJ06DRAFT_250402 [Lipomyces tetrasporus]KAJ8101081.1 hypothetical protein POJ06DRAFT_250402 [Lipomyces tetrasporus]
MHSFIRYTSIAGVSHIHCDHDDAGMLNGRQEDISLAAPNHLLTLTPERTDATSTECIANDTAQIASLDLENLDDNGGEGPGTRDSVKSEYVNGSSIHVQFVESKVDIYQFLSDKGTIDPDDECSWQFLYRHQHSPFGICSYCLEMEELEIYSRQRRQIASQLVKVIHWDSLESVESVTRRAESKADEFVEQLKIQSKRVDQERCVREYQLHKVDSLDEYTIAKMIPGLDAELVRHEWDEYLLKMSQNVQMELRRKRLRKKFLKLLRLGL